MTATAQDAITSRRSHYQIGPGCALPHETLNSLISMAVKHTPSMFNMQATRVIILYGEHHRYLWELCEESLPSSTLTMRPNVAFQHFPKVQDKLEILKNGHGTILFFEDQDVVQSYQDRYPAYTKSFSTWSLQSAAIAQYAVWVLLAESAPTLGITLQHYAPDADKVHAKWEIPLNWSMTGQMPFGEITGPPIEKTFVAEEKLVKVFE
ncbi:uncharacterized protein P7C73_g1164, partial [Tremellales sp. Uapishka_1]